MKSLGFLIVLLIALAARADDGPLQLIGRIALPDGRGRIDHMDSTPLDSGFSSPSATTRSRWSTCRRARLRAGSSASSSRRGSSSRPRSIGCSCPAVAADRSRCSTAARSARSAPSISVPMPTMFATMPAPGRSTSASATVRSRRSRPPTASISGTSRSPGIPNYFSLKPRDRASSSICRPCGRLPWWTGYAARPWRLGR